MDNANRVNKEQHRAYLTQLVTTNQSCQKVPSQSLATQLGRLWSDQPEEEYEK